MYLCFRAKAEEEHSKSLSRCCKVLPDIPDTGYNIIQSSFIKTDDKMQQKYVKTMSNTRMNY